MSRPHPAAGRAAAVFEIGSVGYERRSVDDLICLLKSHGVENVIDVRKRAQSRREGLSKTALSHALRSAGIGYEHMPGLGNPKDNREPFRRGTAESRRRYETILANGASADYETMIRAALAKRTALLCYERSHHECHRSLILDKASAEHGASVVEIGGGLCPPGDRNR